MTITLKTQIIKNQISYSIFAIFILLSSVSFSQEVEMNSINEHDLEAHLSFIANDLLCGRKLSEPGLEIVGQYLISNLKKLNLKPAVGLDNYMQNVDFTSIKPDNSRTLIKISNDSEYIIPGDSILSLFPCPENYIYNGSVVFTGYGIIDSVRAYNDFDNVNIDGKVVMIMSRTSEDVKNRSNKDPFDYDTEYLKIETAIEKGAKAILWVLDPANQFDNHSILIEMYRYAYQEIYSKGNFEKVFNIDFIIITPHTANLILKSTGKSLEDLQNEINSTDRANSFEIPDTRIDLQLIRKVEDFNSPNIIGYIEGSDPELKNEYIIYTAHYDHLGVDPDKKAFNGADDNGSGVVGLLEIAEAYMKLPEPPKRSIVFAWMTAEEIGGLGSEYYINNPLFPIEKTVVCINLDMIGRVKTSSPKRKAFDVKDKDSLFVINDNSSSELLKINTKACNKMEIVPDYNENWRLGYSDHVFFYEKGIPILFYHTGFTADYHTINDNIKKIDFEKMKKVTQVAFLVGFELANMDKKLEIDNPIVNSTKNK